MKKRLATLLAAGSMLVLGLMFTGSAQASTTDSCVELGPGPIGAQ